MHDVNGVRARSVRLDSVCMTSVRMSRGGGGWHRVGVEIPVP